MRHRSTPSSTPRPEKSTRGIFSEQAVYDDEMERIFGRAWLMIGHESLVPAAHDFFHTYMGEDPVILTRDGAGTAARPPQHVPAPRQPRGALRRRQRDAVHVHLPRLDVRQRRRARARAGAGRGVLRRAGPVEARPRRGPGRDVRGDRVRHVGRRCAHARGLPGRRALVPRHAVQPAGRGDAGAGPDEMARARQLEDDGGQLLGQLPRPDHPSVERPGADALPRSPPPLAPGSVREPQPARFRQRALAHVPGSARQHAPVRARRVEGDGPALPGVPRRHAVGGRSAGSARCAPGVSSSGTTASSRTGCSGFGSRCRGAPCRRSSGTSSWSRRTRPRRSSARSGSAARRTTARRDCSSRTTSTTGGR